MNYAGLFSILDSRKISQTSLRDSGLVSGETLTRLRNNQPVCMSSLDILSQYLEVPLFELMRSEKS